MIADATRPWLPQRARSHGSAEAIRFGDDCITWSQLASQSNAVASRLAGAGVRRGDIVALRMAPHPHVVAILHALQSLGAALLPLNLRLAAPELQRIVAHACPRVLVDDGSAPPWTADVPGMRRVHPHDLGADRTHDSHDAQHAAGAAKSFPAPAALDPHAALTIVSTSGTTATPKAVVLTNANHAASAAASRLRLGHGAGDAWLASLPLFHVGGLAIVVRSVLEGSCVILPEQGPEPGFDAGRAAAVLERGDATIVSLVPTMLARVLDRMSKPASARVRCVLVGGAALSPSLGRRALDAGLPIAATYGMTEACSQICSTGPGSEDAARASVGRPLDGTQLLIRDADEQGWGEILVRGPTVMRGYLRNAAADAVALQGGWLHTADIGRIDDRGALEVAGRCDDLIVSGGENISPVEVEHVLDAHPMVLESLVAGVDDPLWGQRLVALVVLRGAPDEHAAHERKLQAGDLIAWCRTRLAPYKIPREFRFASALPRGATGKVMRTIR